MSKHSYLKILRPCDVDIEHVLFKKRVSIGEGVYEYPISYQNRPLIIQTPIIYIPYSTFKVDNKITFDFYFSNLDKDEDMFLLYELILNLDEKVIHKINSRPKIKSGKKKQRRSPKREFISNVKKLRQSCINEKPDKMRVSLFNTIKVFNNLSQPISIDNVKGKASMKLLLCPTKIWVNKGKFGIFWEVLQIKMYPKPELNSYMFLEGKNPHCTCECNCGAKRFNVDTSKLSNAYKCDPRYSVYFDMLKKGVPKQAVINKMIMENQDPSILDNLPSRNKTTNINLNLNNSDEYIVVDGSKPPPPPFPPPPPPLLLNTNSTASNKTTNNMSAVFNDILGGGITLKKISDGDKNKFKKKKRSKSKMRGSFTPSLDEIVNMRKSLRKSSISKSRMDYLKLD